MTDEWTLDMQVELDFLRGACQCLTKNKENAELEVRKLRALLAGLVRWSETDEVKSVFSYAVVHGMTCDEEFAAWAEGTWAAAREMVGGEQ